MRDFAEEGIGYLDVNEEDEGEREDESEGDLAEDFPPWKYELVGFFVDTWEPKKLHLFLFCVHAYV